MFSFFARKQKPRVFLNSLMVVEREDVSFLDKWIYPEFKEIDLRLQEILNKIFTLPPVSSRTDELQDDLAIDVAVPEYGTGDWGYLSAGEITLPLWWRPRIAVKSRIFRLSSNETVKEITIVHKMGWAHYFTRIFSIGSIFRMSRFYPEDFEFMLVNACEQLLDKLRKAV